MCLIKGKWPNQSPSCFLLFYLKISLRKCLKRLRCKTYQGNSWWRKSGRRNGYLELHLKSLREKYRVTYIERMRNPYLRFSMVEKPRRNLLPTKELHNRICKRRMRDQTILKNHQRIQRHIFYMEKTITKTLNGREYARFKRSLPSHIPCRKTRGQNLSARKIKWRSLSLNFLLLKWRENSSRSRHWRHNTKRSINR